MHLDILAAPGTKLCIREFHIDAQHRQFKIHSDATDIRSELLNYFKDLPSPKTPARMPSLLQGTHLFASPENNQNEKKKTQPYTQQLSLSPSTMASAVLQLEMTIFLRLSPRFSAAPENHSVLPGANISISSSEITHSLSSSAMPAATSYRALRAREGAVGQVGKFSAWVGTSLQPW